MKLVLRLIGEAVGVAASFYAFVALIAKVLGVIGLASSSSTILVTALASSGLGHRGVHPHGSRDLLVLDACLGLAMGCLLLFVLTGCGLNSERHTPRWHHLHLLGDLYAFAGFSHRNYPLCSPGALSTF